MSLVRQCRFTICTATRESLVAEGELQGNPSKTSILETLDNSLIPIYSWYGFVVEGLEYDTGTLQLFPSLTARESLFLLLDNANFSSSNSERVVATLEGKEYFGSSTIESLFAEGTLYQWAVARENLVARANRPPAITSTITETILLSLFAQEFVSLRVEALTTFIDNTFFIGNTQEVLEAIIANIPNFDSSILESLFTELFVFPPSSTKEELVAASRINGAFRSTATETLLLSGTIYSSVWQGSVVVEILTTALDTLDSPITAAWSTKEELSVVGTATGILVEQCDLNVIFAEFVVATEASVYVIVTVIGDPIP